MRWFMSAHISIEWFETVHYSVASGAGAHIGARVTNRAPYGYPDSSNG